MGGSGTGGWEMLSRQVAQSQRRLELMAFKRGVTRATLKEAMFRRGAPFEPDRVSYNCFHFCMECRHITEEHADVCPVCGEAALVDLAHDGWAEQVHDMDKGRRKELPKGLKTMLYGGLTMTIFAGFFSLIFFNSSPNSTLWSFSLDSLVLFGFIGAFQAAISAGIALPPYALLLKPLSRLVRRIRPLPPARTRLPVGLGDRFPELSETARGVVIPAVGEMTSPVSGEPCVAYRVTASLQAPDSNLVGERLLDESWGVDFRVGEMVVRCDSVLVDLPVQRVHKVAFEHEREDIVQFLRQRGIDPAAGTIFLTESSVKRDDEVRVDATEDGSLAVITSTQSRRQRKGQSPYR